MASMGLKAPGTSSATAPRTLSYNRTYTLLHGKRSNIHPTASRVRTVLFYCTQYGIAVRGGSRAGLVSSSRRRWPGMYRFSCKRTYPRLQRVYCAIFAVLLLGTGPHMPRMIVLAVRNKLQ